MAFVCAAVAMLCGCGRGATTSGAREDLWSACGNAHWRIEQMPGERVGEGVRATYALRSASPDGACVPIYAFAGGRIRAIEPGDGDEVGRATVRMAIEHVANFQVQRRADAYEAHAASSLFSAYDGLMPPQGDDASLRSCPPHLTYLSVGDMVRAGQCIGYVCAVDGVASLDVWVGVAEPPEGTLARMADAFAAGARMLEDIGYAARACSCEAALASEPEPTSAAWIDGATGAVGYMRPASCYCVASALTPGRPWEGDISVEIPEGFRVVVYEGAHYAGGRLVLLPGTTTLDGRMARPQSAVMIYAHEPVDTTPLCTKCVDR